MTIKKEKGIYDKREKHDMSNELQGAGTSSFNFMLLIAISFLILLSSIFGFTQHQKTVKLLARQTTLDIEMIERLDRIIAKQSETDAMMVNQLKDMLTNMGSEKQ